MPVNMSADFLLDGKPYMLWRGKQGERAWKRERVPDSLTTQRRLWRSISEKEVYGGLPDELDHPEIWDDWNGGFGHYRLDADRPNTYHAAMGVDTRFPGQIILAQMPQVLPANTSPLNDNVEFLLDVPLSSSQPVGAGAVFPITRKGNFGTVTPKTANTFDANAAGSVHQALGHRPAVFGSFVYIPNLSGSGFLQADMLGLSYTVSAIPADGFTVNGARLWKSYQSSLQSVAIGQDPMSAGNWSASVAVGNGQLNISDLFSFEDSVFAGLADGLYQGDLTGTFRNVTTEIGAAVNIDNVRDLSAHNGGVVFAAGESVWWYKPSSGANSEIRQLWPVMDLRSFASVAGNPLLWMSGESVAGLSLKGRITAVQGHGQFLYAGVFTGSLSLLCVGVDGSGAGPYQWHPMQVFPGAKIGRIHVDQITASSGGNQIPQRLWVAMDATYGAQANCTTGLYYWPIPKANGNPLSDPTFSPNYYPFGIIEQSVTDSAVPSIWKVWRKVETWTEGAGASTNADSAASTSLTIGALLDGTMLATFDSQTYSQKPKDFHYFKNANNDAVAMSARFQMRLTGGASWNTGLAPTGGTASTPVVRAMVGHNAFRPRIAEQVTAKVRIADRIEDRQGNEMRPGATMLDELDTMSRSSNPFPLTDLVGRTYPVLVLPGVDEEEAYQVGSDYPEIMATVKLGIIDASWNAAPSAPFHPDGG
jgi:hypothetical protein